jgi:hypothetical protein
MVDIPGPPKDMLIPYGIRSIILGIRKYPSIYLSVHQNEIMRTGCLKKIPINFLTFLESRNHKSSTKRADFW